MQTLTIKLENSLYRSLKHIAQQFGKTPEEMTAQWVAAMVERFEREQTNLSAESALDGIVENDSHLRKMMSGNPDPLLALAGTLECDSTDLSERHDEYIGQALRTESSQD